MLQHVRNKIMDDFPGGIWFSFYTGLAYGFAFFRDGLVHKNLETICNHFQF